MVCFGSPCPFKSYRYNISGPNGCLHKQWATFQERNTELGEFTTFIVVSLFSGWGKYITSSLKVVYCKHKTEEWPEQNAVRVLHSCHTKSESTPIFMAHGRWLSRNSLYVLVIISVSPNLDIYETVFFPLCLDSLLDRPLKTGIILKVFWSPLHTFTLITIVIEHLLRMETWDIWTSLVPDARLYYFLLRITRYAVCLIFTKVSDFIFFSYIFFPKFDLHAQIFSCMLFLVFHCLPSYT